MSAVAEATAPRLSILEWAGLALLAKRAQEEANTPTFRGAALDAQSITERAWLLSGPAETGKTYGGLWRLDTLLRETPGARAALVRKVRNDMGPTVLETYERVIRIRGGVTPFGGAHPEFYEYENGSRLYVGGMDRPGKVLSGERDFIFVNQAEELQLEDWETLTTRCTGRGAVTATPMIMGDCNPGPPAHWIKAFAERGVLRLLESRHEDNPTLHDGTGWTAQGTRTLEVLDSLTGVRKERLRYGRWAAAEGIVYEAFDRRMHVIPRFDIPANWRRIGAIDFGYTNPAVLQLWAVDPDGRMYLDREVFRAGTLVSDLAEEWKRLTAGLPLEAVIADHDAEDRATLYRAGVQTRAAVKEVQAGIQKVASRLRPAGDGKPRLYFLEDALVQRDPSLAAVHKPCSTAEEIEAYVWAKSPDGRPVKEEPVKVNDHGMDAMRYAVEYVDRSRGPEPSIKERIETRVEAREIPVHDITARHQAFEQARAEERKRLAVPRYSPTNMGRLRRVR